MLSTCFPTSRVQDRSNKDVAAPAIRPGFLELPKPFVLGVATASYQIEGSAKAGGRKPSIWDDFSHMPGKTINGDTGDVACDHCRWFEVDVEVLAELGVDAYRFSISWSRLLPDGRGEVNPEGAAFYSNLIDRLLDRGITPWITLYHWDFPSVLADEFGAWLGPKDVVTDAFGYYARTCFRLFGDRVKHWITINEPWCICVLGYCNGEHAPGRKQAPSTEPYIAAHNVLLAHAEAVRIFRREFASCQSGTIGIAFNTFYKQPLDASDPSHVAAAQRAMDFDLGWFADPIYFGDYPESMRATCGDRLPSFTDEERSLLKNSCDFFGINSYSTSYVRPSPSSRLGSAVLSFLTPFFAGAGYFQDALVFPWMDSAWEHTDMGWPIIPWGLRELLTYIQRRYSPAQGIVITENGCAHEPKSSLKLDRIAGALNPMPSDKAPEKSDDTFEDLERVRYLRAHLAAVHAAREQGADVRAYFCWSLMDNFEWSFGYAKRFGIVRVDYSTQKRTIKQSGRFLSTTIRNRGFEAPLPNEQYGGRVF